MRLICLTLLSILWISSSFSQTKIVGRFPSYPHASVRVVGDQSSLNDFQGKIYDTALTDNKGEFVLSFQIDQQKPLTVFIDRIFLKCWIIPENTLLISEKEPGQFQFEGKAAMENKIMLATGIMMPNALTQPLSTPKFNPTYAIAYFDSLENSRLHILSQMSRSSVIETSCFDYCKADIESFTAFSKSQYPSKFLYMDKSIQPKDIPTTYYDFWSKFKLQEDQCSSDMYHNALRDFIGYKASTQPGISLTDLSRIMTETLKQSEILLKDHPISLQKQLAETILFMIRYLELPEITDTAVKQFQSRYMNDSISLLITKEWNKKKKNSMKEVSFTLLDSAGKQFNVESLRGKLLYIDFWGSWCKACLAQWPNTVKLQQAFKHQEIVFVFIDFYDSKEKWIKTIQDKKMNGIHVKAEKSDEQYFNDVFGIANGFPRYAVVDREGRLITSSAPHPNDPSINQYLKKLLSEQ